MISHGSVAARVRRDREQHPEQYCTQCLWRIQTRGQPTPCPRHPKAEPAKKEEATK